MSSFLFLTACIEGDINLLKATHREVQRFEIDNGFRYACRNANLNVIRSLKDEYTLSSVCIQDGLCWAAEQGHDTLVLSLLGDARPTNRILYFMCWGKLYSRIKSWIAEYGLDLSWVDMQGKQGYIRYLHSTTNYKK